MSSDKDIVADSSVFPTETFPFLLHRMLEAASAEGFEHIVGWLPDGERGFVVRDKALFVKEIMAKFFQHTKWKSFLRQLNLYSFQRLSKRNHNECSSYGHRYLIRDKPHKCRLIRRSNAPTRKSSKALRTSSPSNSATVDCKDVAYFYHQPHNSFNLDENAMKAPHCSSSSAFVEVGRDSSHVDQHSMIDPVSLSSIFVMNDIMTLPQKLVRQPSTTTTIVTSTARPQLLQDNAFFPIDMEQSFSPNPIILDEEKSSTELKKSSNMLMSPELVDDIVSIFLR